MRWVSFTMPLLKFMKQIFLFFHLLYSWDAEVASLADTWQPKESGK